ncbi:MAG: glutamate-cysteine ligase family protein [Phycisphaerales bacterium JB039]
MSEVTASMTGYRYPLGLLEGVGVELEYMIADSQTLDVRPIADEVLKAVTGGYTSDAEPDGPGGVIGWSNELALHVIELKTIAPVGSLEGLAPEFQEHVGRINAILAPMGARLLPTAMHPWMDPDRDLRLWPHEYNAVYEAFNRIFSCRGHGWANLQSAHLNLPFANDEEFGRLHAAIRAVLPLVPALAASSPVVDGQLTGLADTRLEVYRNNSRRVPLMAARVIPEPVFTRGAYEGELLAALYRQLAPLDPEAILRQEWANARGAIARFDRGSIEIRVVDVQECPAADIAIAGLLIGVVRALCEQRWISMAELRALEVEPLHDALLGCIREGERAKIRHAPLLRALGAQEAEVEAGELWSRLARATVGEDEALAVIFSRGTLSTRMRRSLGAGPDRGALRRVYAELADCLRDGRMFGSDG